MNESTIQLLHFPVSLLLATVWLLIIFSLHRFLNNNPVVKYLSSRHAGILSMSVAAVMMAFDGTFSLGLSHTVAFAIVVLFFQLCLGLAVLNALHKPLRWGFLFNHLGMFLIVWAAFWGAPDVVKAKIAVPQAHPVHTAMTEAGNQLILPFSMEMEEFVIDYYQDGVSPKQYTSRLLVDGKPMTTAVNDPLSYMGYSIIQSDFDHENGQFTVLQVVKDPWLPVVMLGICMLAAGALFLLSGKFKAKVSIPAIALLTVAFTAATLARVNFGTLMPALRSLWFFPHVLVYMIAYSVMAVALVLSIISAVKTRESLLNAADVMVRISSALLVIGMLCGAVWARQAWGDYWTWDPKESWAAVTWFITLIYLHAGKKAKTRLAILIIAFLALQITWYGVNYLPSAGNGLHSYNR